MHDFSLDWKPKKKKKIKAREVEEDLVLYDPLKDSVYLLNKTARVIFEMCDGKFSVQEIVDTISKTLNLDKDRVFDDVKKTLNELRKQDIIE